MTTESDTKIPECVRQVVTLLKLIIDQGRQLTLNSTISDDRFLNGLGILVLAGHSTDDIANAMQLNDIAVREWCQGRVITDLPPPSARQEKLRAAYALLHSRGIRYLGTAYNPTTGEPLK